ncbi:cytidine deaminase [Granulicella sp. dw_53]|uniref:cytidine deaminase n=1 Tax=Granulicella sp. dw_53 TaxID=2719792 RepID=UPI001BD4ED0A|nr:cytidine deaminase [Granulicella sp. dw_53]
MPTPDTQVEASPTLTPSQLTDLNDRAAAVALNAHAPYSHFRVGAAILLASDPATNILPNTILTGCNVENASFRLTTCAEQSAIAAAVALYGPSIRLDTIVVVNLNGAVCPPCGACRQTIQEFSTPTTRIFFPGPNGITVEASIADLLPAAFLSESLLPDTPQSI